MLKIVEKKTITVYQAKNCPWCNESFRNERSSYAARKKYNHHLERCVYRPCSYRCGSCRFATITEKNKFRFSGIDCGRINNKKMGLFIDAQSKCKRYEPKTEDIYHELKQHGFPPAQE